jgi:hypothetical protein
VNVLSFIASLVSSLAWPAVVVIVAILLRKPLMRVAPYLRTVKYSDIELSFGQEVAEVQRVAEAALPRQPESKDHPDANWEEIMRLSEARPRSAIREAWRRVETELAKLAKARNLEPAPSAWSMPMVLGALMFNAGFISDAQYTLLGRLRKLVSDAERAPIDTISADSAELFVRLALRFVASLEP